MTRTITVQFDVEVPQDDYDYAIDENGRLERLAGQLLKLVTSVATSGPTGSGYVPPKPVEPTPEEIVQQVCAQVRALYPTATTFHVSSSDQGMFGYYMYNVGFGDGVTINDDSGTFVEFADELNGGWLMDLRWGAFGDKGNESQFDVDVTTGKIIRD